MCSIVHLLPILARSLQESSRDISENLSYLSKHGPSIWDDGNIFSRDMRVFPFFWAAGPETSCCELLDRIEWTHQIQQQIQNRFRVALASPAEFVYNPWTLAISHSGLQFLVNNAIPRHVQPLSGNTTVFSAPQANEFKVLGHKTSFFLNIRTYVSWRCYFPLEETQMDMICHFYEEWQSLPCSSSTNGFQS